MRHTERVETDGDVGDGRVDLGVGTVGGDVDRPGREHVADAVELHGCGEQLDDVRLDLVGRDAAAVERSPQRGTASSEQRGVLAERPFEAPNEREEVVDPFGRRLGVPHEGGTQTPALDAWTFGEVDESGELGDLDVGGHVQSL